MDKFFLLDSPEKNFSVIDGEYCLFLIHQKNQILCHDETDFGECFYVKSLLPGDIVFGHNPIVYEDKTFVFMVKSICKDSVCKQDQHISPNMAEYIQHDFYLEIKNSFAFIESNEPDEILKTLLSHIYESKQRQTYIKLKNDQLTQGELNQKIKALGEIANISAIIKEEKTDVLAVCLKRIAKKYKFKFDEVFVSKTLDMPMKKRVYHVLQNIGWRSRKIGLSAGFTTQTAGLVLGFKILSRNEDGEANEITPVLLNLASNGSTCFDPANGGGKVFITAKDENNFLPIGYVFYETFSREKMTRLSLLKFALSNIRSVLTLLIIIGCFSAGIGMTIPLATQYITQHIIPTASKIELNEILYVLILLQVVRVFVDVVPAMSMTLFATSQYERFQAAVFDHILRIPVNSFRKYDTGDMTDRILSASKVQETIFGVITKQLLQSIFSLSGVVMMFWYSWEMALVGIAFVFIYCFIFLVLSQINLKALHTQREASGKVSGLLKQFFDGIIKIRAAGAEQRILSRFTDDFSVKVEQNYFISRNSAIQKVILSIISMLISIVFYCMAGGLTEMKISLPLFMAFISSFQMFQSGLFGVVDGIWTLLVIKPEIDRLLPILQIAPEDNVKRFDCGVLDGKVELSHVNFRYTQSGPLVLDDVSIEVHPGEFIAIVGPSGAGKSSLVRLLLGFEKPEKGAIYYSGKDLSNLDLQSVRRQLGVILQSGKVLPESIATNVLIGTDYKIQDAWEALEQASFADEVKEMPMDIHTLVSPENISGGQQQRILIARALIGKPSIIIMDESTSALDNVAQDNVKKNMEKLHTTRIVIAHRLSTIVQADRIYVMDKGKIVEQGNFKELMAKNGMFKKLAERQLV